MIDVIFENEEFLVVNKPNNADFHDNEETLGFFNTVKETLNLNELYPVHRLDKVTSGLLLIAKTKFVCAHLTRLFQERSIEKLYLALAYGKPKKKQGLIKGDMIRARRGAWRLDRTLNNPAQTHFLSYSVESGLRLYLLYPKTGKTHQLRAALKSLGTPILGDHLYGGGDYQCDNHPESVFINIAPKDEHRVYLHAFALRFHYCDQEFSFFAFPQTGLWSKEVISQSLGCDSYVHQQGSFLKSLNIGESQIDSGLNAAAKSDFSQLRSIFDLFSKKVKS